MIKCISLQKKWKKEFLQKQQSTPRESKHGNWKSKAVKSTVVTLSCLYRKKSSGSFIFLGHSGHIQSNSSSILKLMFEMIIAGFLRSFWSCFNFLWQEKSGVKEKTEIKEAKILTRFNIFGFGEFFVVLSKHWSIDFCPYTIFHRKQKFIIHAKINFKSYLHGHAK